MQEDNRENFVLLSAVAKEKKYAQEYLGLLARRGDIGSIRIGKRWYTTWQWFEEFLENSQKKKEVAGEVQVAEPLAVEKIAPVEIKAEVPYEIVEKIPANVEVPVSVNNLTVKSESEKQEIKISMPFVFPEREKVAMVQSAVSIEREEKVAEEPAAVETLAGKPAKVAIAVKTRKPGINIQKNVTASEAKPQSGMVRIRTSNQRSAKQMAVRPQMESKLMNLSVAARNKYAAPYPEIKIRKKPDVFSPSLPADEITSAPVFGRFAMAMSFATILLLVAASGYFVFSGGLLKSGQVAGASDERNGGFLGIKSDSDLALLSAGDKIKESLSISKLVAEAAKEKQETVNSEQ